MEKGRCHNGRQPQGPRTTRPAPNNQGRVGGPKILLGYVSVEPWDPTRRGAGARGPGALGLASVVTTASFHS